MPIDAGIYSLQQQPKFNTPFENLSQVMQLRNQQLATQTLAQERQAQTQDIQQKQADQSAVDQLLSGATSIDDAISKAGAAGHGHIIPVLQTMKDQLLKQQELQATLTEKKQASDKAELDYAAGAATSVLSWKKYGPEAMMNAFKGAVQVANAHGHDVSQLEQAVQQDPTTLEPRLNAIIAQAQGPQKPEPFTLKPGEARFGPDNQQVASVPEDTSLQSKDVMLNGQRAVVNFNPKTGKMTKMGTGEDVSGQVAAIPPASTIINPQAQSDVHDTVAGMMAGTIPPMLPGRATKEYLATMAEAQRQGYNLTAAVTDWNATQKHIATLNGQQQTRLNQSINALPDLLSSVDDLATQWNAGRFPLLNKANLAIAKNGAYGSKAAGIANQLDAQIADVTADLGNVYMGGNSPTDQALGLAAKSLSSDWDSKVLHTMVDRARQNVTIRRNSIQTTGVQGASANNPYGSQQNTAASGGPPPTTTSAGPKVGDVVNVKGQKIKITAIHPDGSFDGNPVK